MLGNDPIRIACTIIALLSTIAAANAATPFPVYPVRPAHDYAISAEAAPLTVGVAPVEDPLEQKNYFRADLAHMGFVPVFVVIQNASSADSYMFDKMKVTFGPADSSVTTPKTGSKGGEALALSAIPFVGLFPALKVVRNATEVQQNVLLQELQSTTLSPGASAHGFLYIPVPKNATRQKIHLHIPIGKSGSAESLALDLVF